MIELKYIYNNYYKEWPTIWIIKHKILNKQLDWQ